MSCCFTLASIQAIIHQIANYQKEHLIMSDLYKGAIVKANLSHIKQIIMIK